MARFMLSIIEGLQPPTPRRPDNRTRARAT